MHLRQGNWLMQDIFVAYASKTFEVTQVKKLKKLISRNTATFVIKFYTTSIYGNVFHSKDSLCKQVRTIPYALQTCERLLLGRKPILLDSKS